MKRRLIQRPDRFSTCFRLVVAWYVIWFLVGLIFVGFNLPPLFGPIEDFLFIFLAALVLFMESIRRVGWPAALLAFGWVAIVSGAVETLGALTGFPFGHYQYTDNFGPSLMGVLPIAIPLAWWVVILPLQVVAVRLSERNWFPVVAIPPLVGLGAACIDLALEPVATLERGYWIWEGPGSWYGVPWTNFLGWFLTASLLSAGLLFFSGSVIRRGFGWESPSAHMVPIAVLVSILLTFLLASLIAGYWLAGFTAFVVALLLLQGLRYLGPIRVTTLLGR